MSIRLDPLKYVAEGNKLQILSHLNPQELVQCCQVSKEWSRLASDGSLWRGFFPEKAIPLGVNVKKYIDGHAVKSEDEAMQRIQEFANKVLLNQKGTFTCFFPFKRFNTESPEFFVIQLRITPRNHKPPITNINVTVPSGAELEYMTLSTEIASVLATRVKKLEFTAQQHPYDIFRPFKNVETFMIVALVALTVFIGYCRGGCPM